MFIIVGSQPRCTADIPTSRVSPRAILRRKDPQGNAVRCTRGVTTRGARMEAKEHYTLSVRAEPRLTQDGVVLQVTTPSWPEAASKSSPRRGEANTLGCLGHNNVKLSQQFFALKLRKV